MQWSIGLDQHLRLEPRQPQRLQLLDIRFLPDRSGARFAVADVWLEAATEF